MRACVRCFVFLLYCSTGSVDRLAGCFKAFREFAHSPRPPDCDGGNKLAVSIVLRKIRAAVKSLIYSWEVFLLPPLGESRRQLKSMIYIERFPINLAEFVRSLDPERRIVALGVDMVAMAFEVKSINREVDGRQLL